MQVQPSVLVHSKSRNLFEWVITNLTPSKLSKMPKLH